jgi:pimeloyl-ACP methyl ester carboxylesterase
VTNNKISAIVILGGFLSDAAIYSGFKRRLAALTGKRVYVVDTRFFDWPLTISKVGWLLLLNKLDAVIKEAFAASANQKLTLIGHSQGGLFGRLYLSHEPVWGKRFGGHVYIDRLITLGSPHQNQGGVQRGGNMSRWVQQHVPDSIFEPQVRYSSVAGKYVYGRSAGKLSERFAHKIYKDIGDDGEVWGDGMVPVSSALLSGSQQIVLDGVSHHAILGQPWYGSEDVIQVWWSALFNT